jgi:hypothetical protein
MRRTLEQLPAATGWWIVETEELGATACPSELFANQASEVCRGAPNFLHVLKVRAADPNSEMDALAIKQSRKEIEECTMDALQRSGALDHRHRTVRDVGRVVLLPRAHRPGSLR